MTTPMKLKTKEVRLYTHSSSSQIFNGKFSKQIETRRDKGRTYE
jgi:hypothetical protein